ncbi:FKBP-type peptidyl-prolyl cis-trans isomerase SlyD [Rhodobacteraceae bacterium THAF1]|uniref:FKBP-type peptidyl-prolyl cis-trans isomerase n=1 Tax=Palleronia sp. THAF1 TaxID=2587842 RepID=UPI000F3DFB12|nr:peptidylprolyl isomerase [Palleronia sp. THAF1]QFU09484.1 FKBP-type peptidyl-prolyl cis-trans isomerase SlyD [Palleronia sp. THAF1]VDC21837.1 FKBP-type peptidyl-prolyl cis-trans isomerase SlyD [Rhodobacteraceae bacterium THAF1]
MSQAKAGDTIAMHYSGSLADGTTFDSSQGREPLEFQLGSGQIIPGLDSALHGMEQGDKKQVKIAPEQAYGDRDPARVQAVPREQIPADIPVDPGTQLQMQTPDGQAIPVMVTESNDTEVTIDANHPLAGQELTFDVEIVEIK